jgi:hypothetical protein
VCTALPCSEYYYRSDSLPPSAFLLFVSRPTCLVGEFAFRLPLSFKRPGRRPPAGALRASHVSHLSLATCHALGLRRLSFLSRALLMPRHRSFTTPGRPLFPVGTFRPSVTLTPSATAANVDYGAESLQESAAPLTACGIPCVRLTSFVHDLSATPP